MQLTIVGASDAGDRVELEPFVEDEIVGVARHPGLLPVKRGTVAPSALRDVMLLAREPESSTQGVADKELRAAGIEAGGTWELGSSEAVKRAARAGLGFAFLSRYAVAEEVERGELEHFASPVASPCADNSPWLGSRQTTLSWRASLRQHSRGMLREVRVLRGGVSQVAGPALDQQQPSGSFAPPSWPARGLKWSKDAL